MLPRPAPEIPAADASVPRDAILRELDRIQHSPYFRTSLQCQRFLKHVVERTVDGDEESLHERAIGCDLFGRKADYDPASDSIVRVRAGEIRKRLAQYYLNPAGDWEVRIELPAGSYRARFAEREPQTSAAPAGARPRLPKRWAWAAAALLVAAACLAPLAIRETPLESFWRPVLASRRPVLICSGHPVVYFLSSRIHERYREGAAQRKAPLQTPYVIPLRPDERVEGRDIIPVTDQYVGTGDSVVATRLAALFGSRGKDWQLRFGSDVSFADLRSAPAVLIGAFSNRWTLAMTDHLRFVFSLNGGVKRIVDRQNPRNEWALPDVAPDGRTSHDYAIVSRVFQSETGELVIGAAGITQYGTRAAAEFLTSEALMEQAFRGAPSDWKRRNVQVVLHTKVTGSTPGPPEILAVHCW